MRFGNISWHVYNKLQWWLVDKKFIHCTHLSIASATWLYFWDNNADDMRVNRCCQRIKSRAGRDVDIPAFRIPAMQFDTLQLLLLHWKCTKLNLYFVKNTKYEWNSTSMLIINNLICLSDKYTLKNASRNLKTQYLFSDICHLIANIIPIQQCYVMSNMSS